jgi:hypothetical protein
VKPPAHPAIPRVRHAAVLAPLVFPPATADWIRRELGVWCDSGWRFDTGRAPAIAEEIIALHETGAAL